MIGRLWSCKDDWLEFITEPIIFNQLLRFCFFLYLAFYCTTTMHIECPNPFLLDEDV